MKCSARKMFVLGASVMLLSGCEGGGNNNNNQNNVEKDNVQKIYTKNFCTSLEKSQNKTGANSVYAIEINDYYYKYTPQSIFNMISSGMSTSVDKNCQFISHSDNIISSGNIIGENERNEMPMMLSNKFYFLASLPFPNEIPAINGFFVKSDNKVVLKVNGGNEYFKPQLPEFNVTYLNCSMQFKQCTLSVENNQTITSKAQNYDNVSYSDYTVEMYEDNGKKLGDKDYDIIKYIGGKEGFSLTENRFILREKDISDLQTVNLKNVKVTLRYNYYRTQMLNNNLYIIDYYFKQPLAFNI